MLNEFDKWMVLFLKDGEKRLKIKCIHCGFLYRISVLRHFNEQKYKLFYIVQIWKAKQHTCFMRAAYYTLLGQFICFSSHSLYYVSLAQLNSMHSTGRDDKYWV